MDSAMEWAVKRERELRKWSYFEVRVREIGLAEAGIFACENPEEQWVREMEEAYELSDPKHPSFHSVHADIYDQREGK